MKTKILIGLAVVAACALVIGPAALADPSDDQYGNPSETVVTETVPTTTEETTTTTPAGVTTTKTTGGDTKVAGQTSEAAPTQSGETLPFTGLDLGIVLLVGASAIVGGLLLRRRGRGSDSH